MSTPPPPNLSEDDAASKIERFIRRTQEENEIPGLAVSIARDQRVLFTSALGVKKLGEAGDIRCDTLFHMASVSKVFVAEAVLQLAEQERISLDHPIKTYLPDFEIADERQREITIRRLLSHSAGLPDITDYHWDAPEFDDQALHRYIHSLKDVRLLFQPGSSFAYSNMGYDLLGQLIACVEGAPFESCMQQNILEPLGMRRSAFLLDAVPAEARAAPHSRTYRTEPSPLYPYHRAHAPSSTLHSSADEMCNWMRMNLNGGSLNGKSILQAQTHASLWKPVLQTGKERELVKAVGLGWFLGSRRGVSTVSHSGQDVGFTTHLLLAPDRGLGISLLCNLAPAPLERILLGILDILLGFEAQPIRPSILLPLGKIYMSQGAAGMKAAYEEFKSKHPEDYDFDPGAFFAAANALLDQGENLQAVDLLSFALEIEPRSAHGYEALARAFFQLGDMPRAITQARKSLELNPDNPFLQYQMRLLSGEE